MTTILHPHSLAEAVAMLRDDSDARALAGGTAIQILRRQGMVAPSALVDLDGLPELHGIRVGDARLSIGAIVTHREVELSTIVGDRAPLLSEAYRRVGNIRVRHTATVGGNLAHGDYRLDPPAVLIALGATAHTAGPGGERLIPMQDFFVDLLETALQPAELLVEISLPLAHPRRSGHFVKFSSLGANDWPCVAVAALLEWNGSDGPEAARLGVTAMAPTPLAFHLNDVAGLKEADLADAAVEAVLAAVDPIEDIRGSVSYKRSVCQAVVRDAIAGAWHAPKEAARP
jgi:aerobic carbon-monoxide dehydrogenase medium subunit